MCGFGVDEERCLIVILPLPINPLKARGVALLEEFFGVT